MTLGGTQNDSITLSGNNSYTGGTTVGGTVTAILGSSNALGHISGTVNLSTATSRLNLNGFSQTVGALTGVSGSVITTAGGIGTSTLTVGSGKLIGDSSTFAGILQDEVGIGAQSALTKTGAGTQIQSGANTYTGVTRVNQGTLSVGTIGNGGVAGNLGAASNDASSLVFGGGTLQYTGATASSDRAFTITNGVTATIDVTTNNLSIAGATSTATTGALTKIGSGTLTLTGANTYTGGTTVNAGTLALSGAGRLADTGAVTVSGGTLDLGGVSDSVGAVTLNSGTISNGTLTGTSYSATGSGTVSAVLAGSGRNFTQTGTGSVTFSAVNTYTGTTLVSGGTLILSGSGSIASSSTVDVASGATLDHSAYASYTFVNGQTLQGTGTIVGDSVVNGNLRPGNSPGVLSFTGDLTLGDPANSTFEIQNTGMGRGLDYDGVNVTGGGSILTYDGILTLSMTDLIANGTYDLFAFGGFDSLSNFNNVVFAGLGYTGTFAFNSGVWTATSNDQVFSFGLASGDLIVSAIPEPSTTLLLAGALTALVIFRRRRRA